MVETQRYPVCASLTKQVSLAILAENIHNALLSGSVSEAPGNASTLLTPQEEKVLTMWMEGASNNAIACALSIHGKTVYTPSMKMETNKTLLATPTYSNNMWGTKCP